MLRPSRRQVSSKTLLMLRPHVVGRYALDATLITSSSNFLDALDATPFASSSIFLDALDATPFTSSSIFKTL